MITSKLLENIQALHRPDRGYDYRRDASRLFLDKNENTDPQYNVVISDIIAAMDPRLISTYPELDDCYRKLATYLGYDVNNICLTDGSDGAIRAIFSAYVDPGDVVIYTQPTYAMYPVYAQLNQAHAVSIDYTVSAQGPELDFDALLQTVASLRPKLVCLPNPDSPTGCVVPPEQLLRLYKLARAQDALVLIDEAYYPFYSQTALRYINEYDNLVVTRSTGKAWGLSGLRIGYAVGNKTIIENLQKMRGMYEVNSVAAAIFSRILDCEDEMLSAVKRLLQGKAYFVDSLARLGLQTYAGHGNFMHVKFGQYADVIHAAIDKLVYYRKDFAHTSLRGYSRFSATTKENYAGLVSVITETLATVGEAKYV